MDEHGIWLTSDFYERRSPTACFMTAIFISEFFLSAHWIANGAMLLDNIYTGFGTYQPGVWMIVCFMASWKITRPVVAFLCRFYLNKRTDPVIARRRVSCRNRGADAGAVGDGQPSASDGGEIANAQSTSNLDRSTSTAGLVSSSTGPQAGEPSPARAQEAVEQRTNDDDMTHNIDELRYVPTKMFQVTATVASLLLACCMVGLGFITHYTIQVVLFGISTGILTTVISTCTRYHIKQFYRTYPYNIHRFTKQLARCTSLAVMSFAFPLLPLIDKTYRSSMPFFLLATFLVPLVMIQVVLRFLSCTQDSGTDDSEHEMNRLMSRYANYRESPNQSTTFWGNLRRLVSKFLSSCRAPNFFFFFFMASLSSALIVEVFSLYLVSFPYFLYERKPVMIDPLKESSWRSAYIALGWLPTVLAAYLGPHNSSRRGECIARVPSRNRLSRRLAIFIFGLVLIAISLLKLTMGHAFRDPGYILFGTGSAAVFYLERDVFSLLFKGDFDVIYPFIQIATGLLILPTHSTWLAITRESAHKDFKTALTDAGHWVLLAVAAFWTVILICKTGKFLKRICPRRERRSVNVTDDGGAAGDAGNS